MNKTDGSEHSAVTDEHLNAEMLYRAHADFVGRFLLRLGAQGQDVPDLLQEVFLVAHRRGGFIVDRAKPTTWLAEISFRVFSDRRKKSRRKLEDADSETVTLSPSGATSLSERAEKREALVRVQSALDSLTPEKRAVFILYELEGESCDSIASGLGIPVGTVYSRLHSARRDFAQAYQQLTDETPSAGPVTPDAIAGARL